MATVSEKPQFGQWRKGTFVGHSGWGEFSSNVLNAPVLSSLKTVSSTLGLSTIGRNNRLRYGALPQVR